MSKVVSWNQRRTWRDLGGKRAIGAWDRFWVAAYLGWSVIWAIGFVLDGDGWWLPGTFFLAWRAYCRWESPQLEIWTMPAGRLAAVLANLAE